MVIEETFPRGGRTAPLASVDSTKRGKKKPSKLTDNSGDQQPNKRKTFNSDESDSGEESDSGHDKEQVSLS